MAVEDNHHRMPRTGEIGFALLLLLAFGLSGCGRLAVSSAPTVEAPATETATTYALLVTASETWTPQVVAVSTSVPEWTTTPAPVYTPTRTITAWPNATPTFGPSPTRTRTPTSTRIPTRTRAPTRTPTITLTPTITNTPTPPSPVHDIVRPGLLSKLVSPIQMEVYVETGAGGNVSIELVGEDGRVISRQLLDYGREGRYMWAGPEVPFEIEAAAETARLQVLTYDEFGRIMHLSSVDVILLAVGRNEINPPAITQAPYLVRSPDDGEVIRGGKLRIEGLARPVNESPLLIELIGEDGSIYTTKQLVVPPPSGPLSHTPFTVEIAYKVFQPTPVRLVIRQEGSRIRGTVALYSQTIILEP